LTAPYTDDAGQSTAAALPDVCFKPFGTVCATQSILQFWQMNRTYYDTGGWVRAEWVDGWVGWWGMEGGWVGGWVGGRHSQLVHSVEMKQ